MFDYIVNGRYALTILLIASIVGYLVFAGLQWRSRKKRHDGIQQSLNDEYEEDEDSESDDSEMIVVEEEEVLIITEADEEKTDSEETIVTDSDAHIEDLIAGGEEPAATDEAEPEEKKFKGKNIAEGVSRDDILQDKHDKSLQKIKYEALLSKQRNDLAGYEKKLIEGLMLEPSDIDIFRQLADLYFTEGKYTKALSMFRKILTLEPNDHHALWQMGEIYIEQEQWEDAQVFIEKALKLSPDNPKYYISLADISLAKNDMQTALKYMEKIVALRPKNISYLMALGELYEKLARPEDAKMTYFKVLEIDPLHIDVKHILKRF